MKDCNWSLECSGRSLRVASHHQDRLVVNLVAAGLKKRGTFQVIQLIERYHTGPPVRRLIIHCAPAGRQFELGKPGARVSRKESCCQKKEMLPKRGGLGKQMGAGKGGR